MFSPALEQILAGSLCELVGPGARSQVPEPNSVKSQGAGWKRPWLQDPGFCFARDGEGSDPGHDAARACVIHLLRRKISRRSPSSAPLCSLCRPCRTPAAAKRALPCLFHLD